MNLVIVDGADWFSTRRMFTTIQKRGPKKWSLYIPRFSDISQNDPWLNNSDLSAFVRQNINSLVHLIDGAEQDRFNQVVIWWSPISYHAFAQIKWRIISDKVLAELEAVMGVLKWVTQVQLINPPNVLARKKWEWILTPNEVWEMSILLWTQYKWLFWDDNIRNVDINP